MPKETKEICRLYFEGKVEESAELQLRLFPLIKALFSEVNPMKVMNSFHRSEDIKMVGRICALLKEI